MSDSVEKFKCPYCNCEVPPPSRKRSCPHCKKFILARTLPTGERIWLREEDLPNLEKEWRIHFQKEVFINGASEYKNYTYNEFDNLEARARQAFKNRDRDKAWRLHNQAILKAGERFSDNNWAERFREVYSSMGCQLAAEGLYKDSLFFFAKEIYWSCFGTALEEVRYNRLMKSDKSRKFKIEFSLDVERALPPFILEPIVLAIIFAKVSIEEFTEICLKSCFGEQQLATKLITKNEEFIFEPPTIEMFWSMVKNVIKSNIELRQ